MLEVENVETAGWEPALRGMRNPLNSWHRADSAFGVWSSDDFFHRGVGFAGGVEHPVLLGPNDESLMRRLIGQGSPDHCKFRRMLVIWCDVTAPLYWWKEASTYKVGTVMNSCSTMHTIMSEPFTKGMFSWERIDDVEGWCDDTLEELNVLRRTYLHFKDDEDAEAARLVWNELIQKLPSSWNQRRTWMLNYEVMANIYRARRHHKLQEWHDFIDAMVGELPYPWIFTGEGC